ncbi:MAG: putative Ig domain-containing protein [Acidobacteriota bacterium]
MVRLAFRLLLALLVLTAYSASASTQSQNQSGLSTDGRGGYTLILVEANSKAELAEARDFIASQGGRVAIVLPPHAIMGWISPEVDSRILGRHGIRSIHRTTLASAPSGFKDRETQMAISAFNDVASGRSARRRARESKQQVGPEAGRPGMFDCALPHPALNKDQFIRNLRLLGAEQSVLGIESSVSPQYYSNSDVMDGSVAVAVFLVESTGAIDTDVYTWSQADQEVAFSQVLDGLNWWVEQSRAFNLARPLQFTVVFFDAKNPACRVPYEPLLHSGSDAQFWVNDIMNNLGATAGNVFERVAAFDIATKNQNRTNWAYSMFIAYNPPPARTSFSDGRASWAYIGGPYTVSLFRSFGWQLSRITTHEAGHIFYACDEYFQPGYQVCSCTCAPEVRPDALNGNCQDLTCTRTSTECMMRLNEAALCPFTVAQIGWTSPVPKPAPTAPSGLVAAASAPTLVSLVWQDTSGVEDGFQIERRGGTSADFSQIGVVSVNSTTYADANVLPNTAYSYRVRAFNGTGISVYSNEAPVITPSSSPELTIATADLPEATVGVAYSRTLTAIGGKPDFSWLIESGSLAPGISLAQTGSISGTPSTAGTFNFVAKVTDSSAGFATRALTLAVKSSAPLSILASQLPRGAVGATYSQSIGASGGQTPYTWSLQSGSLPDGITLNQTGIISGTPERPVTTSFVLKLTDAVNASVSATLAITINPATLGLAIETKSLADGVVGENYSQTLVASGGSAPYRWDLKSGRLPDGLNLSDAGVIAGTPTTPGEIAFEARATDQSGQSTISTLSIDVDPPPELTILSPGALPVAALGVPYRYELKATAGSAPYNWSQKKRKKFGAFPDGISLSADGILAGTPTAQGVSNFTLIVTDATAKQASKPLTLEVGPPPPPLLIRTEFLPQALQGFSYNALLEASGGLGPYTWTIETGALPDGLTMSGAGVISGRASTAGASSFVVRVKDSLGTSSTKSLFLIVAQPPPPLVIQTISLPDTTAERAYSQTLQATGGVPPYTWSIASGSLGAGLNISAAGTISGTPTSPGTSVFVVRVTDSAQQAVTRTLAISVKPADKLAPFGALETPGFRVTLSNIANGSGWAVDNLAVVQIDVLIDGQKASEAIYGLNRPDIGATWGSFPNAARSGFSFQIDTTRVSNGDHTVAVRLLDAAGNATLVGTRTIVVQNQVFIIVTNEIARGKKGEGYSLQLAAANGKAPYSWALLSGSLPSGLSLNAAGLISGTPTVFGTFPFAVRATDSNGATAIASYTIVIIPDIEPLRIISSGDLAQGSTGVAYSNQLFFAGGLPPRIWRAEPGSLPPGLSLGDTGLITGVPTAVGTFTFTVQLSDSTSTTVSSQPLRITIVPGPLQIPTIGDLTKGSINVFYAFTLQKAGGAAPYTWALASGALPPGLSLSPSLGVISGTPTQLGTFSFTVRLSDSQLPPATLTSGALRIMIETAIDPPPTAPEPLSISSSGNLTAGKLNKDYSHQLAATGGRPPYTWALAIGSAPLPLGLTLNPITGVILGKPLEKGVFTFTVSVTDTDIPPKTATSSALRITISP